MSYEFVYQSECFSGRPISSNLVTSFKLAPTNHCSYGYSDQRFGYNTIG